MTDDAAIHERLLRRLLRGVSKMDLRQPPPVMGQYIHRLIRRLTGQDDPYRQIKQRHNRLALELYPKLRTIVRESADPFETALRLAIAGNVIDLGANPGLDDACVSEGIEHALSARLDGDVHALEHAVAQAQRILYLADNAGEIAFDRLLLEQMPVERATVAVRGSPVINDATIADTQAAGIPGLVEVIDNGSDAPGTILEDCGTEFRRRFDRADLIIAKGQGNYETLSDVPKDIFFVLKAKCPVIADHLGCRVGSLILRRSVHAPGAALGAPHSATVDSVSP
jgi:uncharacterized protein with ATP-grasp and redox domains